MMKKLMILIAGLLLMLSIAGSASATIMGLDNLGFELGNGYSSVGGRDIYYWDEWETSDTGAVQDNVYSNYNLGDLYATEGVFFAKMTATASIYQWASWEANDTISFDWAFDDQGNMGDYAVFKLMDINHGTIESYTLATDGNSWVNYSTDWATYLHTFVSSGQGYVTFGSYDVGGDTQHSKLLVDNIRTSSGPAPVPEPATMLLLGTGLIGLAGLRRRIKK